MQPSPLINSIEMGTDDSLSRVAAVGRLDTGTVLIDDNRPSPVTRYPDSGLDDGTSAGHFSMSQHDLWRS